MTDDLDAALAAFGLDLFDDETKQAVDAVLHRGQTVEPGARQKLVAAAQRALRVRSIDRGPFEILAHETRIAREIDVEVLAADIGSSVDEVREIERGDRSMTSATPASIARWIKRLGVGDELAVDAVIRSLVIRAADVESAYAAQADSEDLATEDRRFVDEVLAALAELTDA